METAVTSMIDLTGENKNKSQPLLRGIKRVNKSTCVRAWRGAVPGEEDREGTKAADSAVARAEVLEDKMTGVSIYNELSK